ncbi:unnamed protein product [Chrysoparadoxa australica]
MVKQETQEVIDLTEDTREIIDLVFSVKKSRKPKVQVQVPACFSPGVSLEKSKVRKTIRRKVSRWDITPGGTKKGAPNETETANNTTAGKRAVQKALGAAFETALFTGNDTTKAPSKQAEVVAIAGTPTKGKSMGPKKSSPMMTPSQECTKASTGGEAGIESLLALQQYASPAGKAMAAKVSALRAAKEEGVPGHKTCPRLSTSVQDTLLRPGEVKDAVAAAAASDDGDALVQPRDYYSLGEYETMVKAGKIKAYKGKTHATAAHRYGDGWVFTHNKRWKKLVPSQQTRVGKGAKEAKETKGTKEASQAKEVEVNELMRQVEKLQAALAQVTLEDAKSKEKSKEKTEEEILAEQSRLREAQEMKRMVSDERKRREEAERLVMQHKKQMEQQQMEYERQQNLLTKLPRPAADYHPALEKFDKGTAPVLIVFDTNCWLHDLDHLKRVIDELSFSYYSDMSLLIPREVLKELDRKKNRSAANGESISYCARRATRYLHVLTIEGCRPRKYPLLRWQRDDETYADDYEHRHPTALRGDHAILNCLLFFERYIWCRVCLVSNDKNFLLRGHANGIQNIHFPDLSCDRLERLSLRASYNPAGG